MRDIKKTKIAKDWIFQLANGINPIDGTDLSDTVIVNNVHISRCLFYVADVMDFAIRKMRKESKDEKIEFNMDAESLSKVYIAEKTSISDFVSEINKVIPENMKGISNKTIITWLVDNGYLKIIVTDKGAKIKRPTEAGQSIGIFTEQKEGHNGPYVAVLYDANAQNFILNNISAIIEQE